MARFIHTLHRDYLSRALLAMIVALVVAAAGLYYALITSHYPPAWLARALWLPWAGLVVSVIAFPTSEAKGSK